jgi:uncharacterized membrane protein
VNVSNLASQILADMWEYGRVVLILVAFMAIYGFIISKKHDQERSNAPGGLVLIAVCTVGVFALFSSLNVQGANILDLIKDRPSWGIFTIAAVALLVVVSGITAYRYMVASRAQEAITITGASEQMLRRTIAAKVRVSWLIVLLLFFASAVWLWRLARG